ncbi:outer membrane protein A [Klebsiella pneumoniae]|nr:outer membrane protein A [Klebsiella pneumoniae]
MKKRVLMIAALVSGTLAISGCTTNPIPVNVKQANPVLAQVLAP